MQISPISLDGYQQLDSSCPDSTMLHVSSGNVARSLMLFTIPTVGRPLTFTLYHNSTNITPAGDVGRGWRHNVQAELRRADASADLVEFIDESGRQRDFERVLGLWRLKNDSLYEQVNLLEKGDGLWQLVREPDGKTMEFQEEAGSPIVARLVRILDSSSNQTEYVFEDGQLMEIRDPIGARAITLEWDSDRIVGVSDPESNRFALSYSGELLTTLEMPGGCLVEFTYDEDDRVASRSDSTGASTLYTHDEQGRLTQIEGPIEDSVRPTASWSYSSEPVQEVANLSPLSSSEGEFIELDQVFFTTARGKVWEYRFLPSSMLWREINPLGHHRRFFYDERQNLIYSSEGYPRKNLDDASDTAQHDHPRDNINNMFRFYAYEGGNLTQAIDANGLVTAFTYGSGSKPLTSYRGAAHYGIGGDWTEHFGAEGSVLCAYQSDSTDLENLPSYVSAISQGSSLVASALNFSAENPALLSSQVLSGGGAGNRRVGHWTSESSSLDFRIELSEARAFNLSLYTHSLDQLEGSAGSLDYPEFFGREVEFKVQDKQGTQTFRVTQNASGVWATFPVVGDASHPITVILVCRQSEHRPTLAAVAFDPFEDRRIRMTYSGDGFLSAVSEPTNDPEHRVTAEYQYNEDGTTSQVSTVLRESGAVVDSRVTKMFYLDSARNLTRIEDPLNQESAPTLMTYDQNSNMIHLIDSDEKEMFFEYDYRHRMTRAENGLGQVTTMTFDGRGLLSVVQDANLHETQFFYTPSRQLSKVVNALDEATEFIYFPDGLLKSIKDAAGNEVLHEYDDADRLIMTIYPESEVVLPDFSRTTLSPQIRMAYDVWDRLAAVTSPNGNVSDLDNINLLGALNVLRNGSAQLENGTRNKVPTGWQEDRPSGFQANSTMSDGSFPLSVPDTLETGESYDWVQRRPAAGAGGRYLMKGSAQSDLETNFRLRAVVRDFASGLSEQTALTALPADIRTELSARLDLPGDAQVSRTMPVFHQFRAGIEKPASGTASASLEDLAVLALSQVTQYEGEYTAGSTSPDGARMMVLRDRFGRTRRVVDPLGRTVDFAYDARDRILSVTDSQGLSLGYEWDFLGNLVRFTDSRLQETTFSYDDLNRVVKITQPDTGQFETFAYTPAGDLQSYINCREQERQFFYDDAHRLIRIDYIRTLDPTESVEMDYDDVGNLLQLTERNGDLLTMSYDVLNRLESTTRVSADGPNWMQSNQFDSRGNRTALTSGGAEGAVYGEARFGVSRYGGAGEATTIFNAEFNELNQMVSLTDSASNETEFAFDLDGRLAEVNHPVEDLQTRYRYDLVGKLLESRVALGEDELFKLNYSYNLAGERLSQHSVWEDGGNAFEYRLDASGRLIRESINRFVCDGVQDYAEGVNDGTAFALDGKLRLLARDDDFSATYLDLQRWEIAISEPVATSVSMVQNDGLRWRTSVGETLRNGRVLPAGTPIDSSNVAIDYPHIADVQVADTVGWFEGRMLLRHRMPLTGAFDVQIALSDFDVFGASIGLGVTRDRFETADGANRFPTDLGGVIDANGCDIVVEKDTDFLARFNDEELVDVTVQKLRLKRFLDGSDWKLSAYYHDGDDWVTDEAWVGIVDDQELYVYLSLSGKVGYLRWSDFLDTVGDPYPTAGFYESRTYDAGRSVDFTRISWNEVCPSGTDVSFQVAVSEDANGPWSYGSSLTTAAGTTITSTTGRYARFKVSMTSDGSDTPVINDVQVSHDGTSGSRVTRWSFDEAGNIVSQVRITDTGAEIDERSYNSLNQIETSSGGWSYQFDPDGNLIGKNNGTAEGCEKWEFTWNEDCNLVRLTKGIYDATSVLVNSFTVSYQYDETGRMLRRDDGTDVTDYFYDDWDIWKEVTGESVTEYLVPDGIIFSFLRDGELYVLHCDALSSARTVTDSEGAVVAQMEFDAWGQILPGFLDLVPGGMPMGFVGGLGVRTDSLTGLHCMRQRWYDPQLGRFLSRDPIGLKGGNNLYLYAANLPTSRTDESGLNWWEKLNKAQKVGRGGVQLAAELADEIYQNVIKIRDEVVIRTTGKKYIRLDAQVQSPKGKKNIEIKISKNPNTEIRGRRQLANQDLVTGCKDGELLMVPPEIATEELVAVRILKIVGKWVDKGLLGIIIAVGSARTCKATTLKGAAKELGHLTWDLGVYYLAGRAVIRFPALAPVAGGMLYVDLMKLAVGDDPLHQPIYPGTLTSVTGGEINYDY